VVVRASRRVGGTMQRMSGGDSGEGRRKELALEQKGKESGMDATVQLSDISEDSRPVYTITGLWSY
jgi:hypothetical protein